MTYPEDYCFIAGRVAPRVEAWRTLTIIKLSWLHTTIIALCLVVAVQPCMEWIKIKKTVNNKSRQSCILLIREEIRLNTWPVEYLTIRPTTIVFWRRPASLTPSKFFDISRGTAGIASGMSDVPAILSAFNYSINCQKVRTRMRKSKTIFIVRTPPPPFFFKGGESKF